MINTWTHVKDMDIWYRLKIRGTNLNSWYIIGLLVQAQTKGTDLDSCYSFGVMVQTFTYGIVSVLLNFTRTVARTSHFHRLGPLGQAGLVVAMSMDIFWLSCNVNRIVFKQTNQFQNKLISLFLKYFFTTKNSCCQF